MSEEREQVELEEGTLLSALTQKNMDDFRSVFLEQHPYDQASFFINNGYFPEQKIAVLPGFDYFNIGVVDGYDIINKELVEK